jgi:glycosyltransferase involved in cell wall biosynthesis
MSLTVLNVAYPFARVSQDAVGGAEQVLSHLDNGLVRAGHRSMVVAMDGSDVAGTLIAVPPARTPLDASAREQGWQHHRVAIAAALRRWPVDLVHLHGIDFGQYLPPPGTPCLITLHLPLVWYPAEALSMRRPLLWMNCVSAAQARTRALGPGACPPIANGVPVEELQARHAKRRFALFLGRMCPEKAPHLALEAAHQAGLPLLVGGKVFPYPEHQRYFVEAVTPLLDRERRFLGELNFARKRRLLAAARCLLAPSLAEETSSLVAMEALACGTPVVAFARGALCDIIEHGRTGFLVRNAREMADAMLAAPAIDREVCRAEARRLFSRDDMIARYLRLYRTLAAQARARLAESHAS